MNSDRMLQNPCGAPGSTKLSLPLEEGTDWAVVIPVRNRRELLEKCLDSLRQQQFPNGRGEVLICDDGSTEDLSAVIGRFTFSLPNLRLLRQPPKGPAAARNLGFRSSRSKIFVCLDSDIICAPNFLNSLVTTLWNQPEWLAVESRIDSTGRKGPLWDAPVCQKGGRYHTAAIAYRREILVKIGGFDEAFELPACEDVDLGARILREGKIGYVPEAIVYHPTRRITLKNSWEWRRFWKYVMILGKRYGFFAFPGRRIGKFPRLRVALAAVVTLPGGRFLLGCTHLQKNPKEGILACFYSLFDLVCGVFALPDILWGNIPPLRNYLYEEFPDNS